MYLQISLSELSQLTKAAGELGACKALIAAGKLRPYLTKSEAFRQYGRANIERWVNFGLITPRKDGDHSSCWRIDRLELNAISNSILILPLIKSI